MGFPVRHAKPFVGEYNRPGILPPDMTGGPDEVRRRRVLAALGSVAVVGTGGCLGEDTPGDDEAPAGDGGAQTGDGATPTADEGAQSTGEGTPSFAGTATDPLPAPSLGPEDPEVVVEAYKDFACPHCATYAAEVKPQIVSEYVDAGVVRLDHRDLPLPVVDPESWRAASAAREVQVSADDEAFFAYADRLFENQTDLGLDTYADLAENAPGEAVRAAADERRYQATVEDDRATGADRGATGTPAVFVDGDQVDGWDWDAVSGAVEDARSD